MNYPDCKDKNSFQSGLEFQDFVCTVLMREGIVLQNLGSKLYQLQVGESLWGFEIKLDRQFLETGRLSIELAEKSCSDMPGWTPSGIYRSDNTWLYIQGNYDRIYIFPKRFLVSLHKTGRYQIGESPKDRPTVRKYYLPLIEAEKYCARRIDIKGGIPKGIPIRLDPLTDPEGTIKQLKLPIAGGHPGTVIVRRKGTV